MPDKLLNFRKFFPMPLYNICTGKCLRSWHKQNKKTAVISGFQNLVPRDGLEPSHLAAGDFESPASTNFATWASEEDAL